MRVCQSAYLKLTHRHRGQAPSHIEDFAFCERYIKTR